jgi:hypothetical protein
MTAGARRGPSHPDGLRRVNVGSGPALLPPDWWNVDVRPFPGIDEVMDAAAPWPWQDRLDYVYGEHFLEHLTVPQALRFLVEAGKSLRQGGRIRLSTPSLEWVLATHFHLGQQDGREGEPRPGRSIAPSMAGVISSSIPKRRSCTSLLRPGSSVRRFTSTGEAAPQSSKTWSDTRDGAVVTGTPAFGSSRQRAVKHRSHSRPSCRTKQSGLISLMSAQATEAGRIRGDRLRGPHRFGESGRASECIQKREGSAC